MRRPPPLFPLLILCYLPIAHGCRQAPTAAQRTSSLPSIQVVFTDVTAQAGISFRHAHGGTGKRYFLETTGSGACFFDYDNDGWLDLFVVQSGPLPGHPGYGTMRSVLYRNNRNGTFKDVTTQAGIHFAGYGQGCCAGDYNNDGWIDLYVTGYGGNALYRNKGNGTFIDVTKRANVRGGGWSTSCAFADYNNDGDLDLYVANYLDYRVGQDPSCHLPGTSLPAYCAPRQFDGAPDVLYRNNGDETFTDVTRQAGVYDPQGKGLGVVWGDYDNDGDLDLYVANDGTVNRLYQNQGNGTFKDVSFSAGVGLGENGEAQAGMGTDMGDYDNDGWLDIFVANFSGENNSLYHNEGNGTFSDVSFATGVGAPSLLLLGFGADFFDYDNDGFKDIAVANGHVLDNVDLLNEGITCAEPLLMYRNLGNGTFEDVSQRMGKAWVVPRVSRGLATGDYDNDGDLDVFIVNLNQKATLLRNDGGNRNHWMAFRLIGTKGNRDSIGARVTVTVGGLHQMEEVRSGSSYCSQNDLRLYFGLGKATHVDRVEIRWPGGRVETLQNVPSDQWVQVVEGSGRKPH